MLRRIAIVGFVVLFSSRVWALDFGWEQLDDGIEYIVQVRPAQLDAFREQGFSSVIRSGTVPVRRIRLVVGEQPLPNQGELPPLVAAVSPPIVAPSAETVAGGEAPTADPEPGNLQVDGAKPLPPGKLFGQGYFNDPQRNGIEATAGKAADDEAASSETASGSDKTADVVTPTPHIAGKTSADDASDKSAAGDASASSESRPWMPLMITLVALFISLGANAYLVWIHQSLRGSYRALLARLNRGTAIA